LFRIVASFYYIYISQGSVAMRCGETSNNVVIANFPRSELVKEFLKSLNIWRWIGQVSWHFFTAHGA